MVLVTTGLLETLPDKNNEPILFLGEWCKRYKHRNVYEQYTYTTLPYHWDDRKKLYEDTIYIDKIYEKYLAILHQQLNNIHKVDFSVAYWRIIIGPWLRYFIEIVYDRYLSIENASKKNINHTIVFDINETNIIPLDMDGFIAHFTNDVWNHFIYAHIVSFFDIKTVKVDTNIIYPTIKEDNTTIKDKIKNILFRLNKYNKIHFFSSYIKSKYLFLLQCILSQFPTFGTTASVKINPTYSIHLRNSILFPKADSLFEHILNKLIKKQLPLYYLEGYQLFREKSLKTYPSKAKIIFTANAYSADEAFKFWTAEKKEEGTKYIIGQHGGHMGTGLFASYEDHQLNSSDYFFSWGWDKHTKPNVIPVSAIKLNNKLGYNINGDILIPLTSVPRYSYHLMSVPIAGQILNYVQDQFDFIDLSSNDVKKLLKYRIYSEDYGWEIKKRFMENNFENIIDSDTNLQKTFYKRLAECRLCITTYNATTYLETFSANYPTLLYWNPYYWELRNEAKPYFDMLEEAGILHYTSLSLASHLNKIFVDPLSWWNQTKVQKAKDIFCSKFANRNNNYLLDYKKKFTAIFENAEFLR